MLKTLLLFFIICFRILLCDTVAGKEKNAAESRDSGVAATVGNSVVTVDHVKVKMDHIKKTFHPFFIQVAGPDSIMESALENLIDERVFMLGGKEMGLDKDQEIQAQVDAAIADIYRQEMIRRDAEMRKLAGLSDSDLAEYYETHGEDYGTPGEVKIKRMVFLERKNAEEAHGRLKKGEEFDEVSKESQEYLAPEIFSGPLSGWIRKKNLPEPVAQAAFSMEKGKISEIIQANSQFYIIKLEDRKEANLQDFQKVKEKVRNDILTKKRTEIMERKKKELREKYGVKVNKKTMEELR